MQNRRIPVVGVVVALVLAACGGSGPVAGEPGDETPIESTTVAQSSPTSTSTGGGSSPAAGPSIWVVGNEGYTLLRYDQDLNLVDRADEYVGDVDLSTIQGFFPLDGTLWLLVGGGPARLVGLDEDGFDVVADVELPAEPHLVSVGVDRLWVAYWDETLLTEVFADGTADTFDVGRVPARILDEGDHGWMFDYSQNQLASFHPDTRETDLVAPEMSTADARAAVEVGDSLWMTVEEPSDLLMRVQPVDGTVERIWCDDATGTCEVYPDDMVATAGLEGGAVFGEDMVDVDGRLYVAGSAFLVIDSVPLYVIDPQGLQIIARTDLEPVEDLTVLGEGILALVMTSSDEEVVCGRLLRIDPAGLETVAQVDLPDDVCPDAMGVG